MNYKNSDYGYVLKRKTGKEFTDKEKLCASKYADKK